MRRKKVLFVLCVSIVLIASIITASFIEQRRAIKEAKEEDEYYIHNNSLPVIKYSDFTLTIGGELISFKNVERRNNILTVELDDYIRPEWTWFEGIEIAVDKYFNEKLEYNGISYMKADTGDKKNITLFVFQIPDGLSNKMDILYVKTAGYWLLNNNSMQLTVDVPAIIDDHYNEQGKYTGDLSGFIVTCEEHKWFKINEVFRLIEEDKLGRKTYHIEMKFEFCEYDEYMPGRIVLTTEDMNYYPIEKYFESPFGTGCEGTLKYSVPKTVFKNIKNAKLLIMDFSKIGEGDSVSIGVIN